MSGGEDIHPPADGERHATVLTEAQIDDIVERAVEKVFQRIYAEVGKNVLKRLAWVIGLVSMGLLVWLAGKGALPK